jgi:hypothetical protein
MLSVGESARLPRVRARHWTSSGRERMGPPGIPKTGLDRLGDLHKTYTKSRLFGAISFYFVPASLKWIA